MHTIRQTADFSNTLFHEKMGEHYHSTHGALQESRHVFIEAGLKFASREAVNIKILEIGFGTGLNYLLSSDYCKEQNISLSYTALEPFPLSLETIESLGYQEFISSAGWQRFIKSYQSFFEPDQSIADGFSDELSILKTTLHDFSTGDDFSLIYYDAFSARHQPEMWTPEIIGRACGMLKKGGIFVTYAITGDLKRTIRANGFEVQKLSGAPGKREMLRAIKL